MSTRLRRPSIWRGLLITAGLLAFQGYLGWSAIGGNFGVESQKIMKADIVDLNVQSAALQAEIDAYRHKVDLFDPNKLDPDIRRTCSTPFSIRLSEDTPRSSFFWRTVLR